MRLVPISSAQLHCGSAPVRASYGVLLVQYWERQNRCHVPRQVKKFKRVQPAVGCRNGVSRIGCACGQGNCTLVMSAATLTKPAIGPYAATTVAARIRSPGSPALPMTLKQPTAQQYSASPKHRTLPCAQRRKHKRAAERV